MKKTIAMLLAVLLAVYCLPLTFLKAYAADIDDATFAAKIAELQTIYRHGEYWNSYNSCGYEGTGTAVCPNCSGNGYCDASCPDQCGQFYYDGAWVSGQCLGWACKMGNLIFGGNPLAWSVHYDGYSIKPGDIIYGNVTPVISGASCHALFITDVSGDTVTYADCNATGPCQVRWGGTATLADIQTSVSCGAKIYHASNNYTTGNISSAETIEYVDLPEGVYYLKSNYNGEYLSVSEALDNNGQNVNTWAFAVSTEFMMEFTKATSGYKIRPLVCASRLINSYGDTVSSGNNVNIWDDCEESSQWWGVQAVSGGYVIRNMMAPSCVLTVDDSQNVYVSAYTGAVTQIWSIQNTVHFEANGGSGAPDVQIKEYGQSLTLPDTVPAREGYSFVGWSTSSDASSADYLPGDSFDVNENKTLYAVWTVDAQATITFDANGGTWAPRSQTVQRGSTVTVSMYPPDRVGYSFIGWGTSPDADSASYYPLDSITLDGDMTLYAIWETAQILESDLTYEHLEVNIEFDGMYRAYAFTPSFSGSVFLYSEPLSGAHIYVYDVDGNEVAYNYNGDDFSPGGFAFYLQVTAGTTYYMRIEYYYYEYDVGTIHFYAQPECTVTYDANGGTGAPESQSESRKQSLVLSETVPTREGYTFLGWSLSDDALDATYAPGDEYMVVDSVTLYAVWEPSGVASGTCGTDMSWQLSSDGVLTISGAGEMTEYSLNEAAPWYPYISEIRSVIVEDGVTSIGNYAFYNCAGLADVSFADSVTYIGNKALHECTGLTDIILPAGLTQTGQSMFYGCSSLSSVTLPEGLTNIGNSMFYGCSALTSITIPDSVALIDNYAFYGCSSLTSITLPDGSTSIGSYVFKNCSALTTITIPAGVTSIGDETFVGCTELSMIQVVEGNTSYSSDGYGILYDKEKSTLVAAPGNIEYCVIPDSVTKIGGSAFSGCSRMTSITIPAGVTNIGVSAFCDCSGLVDVTILGAISIKNYAFENCSSLSDITLPESLTSIGEYAFCNCSDLSSITIPDSVTSIGSAAFARCSSLSSVILPDGVTSIRGYLFANCSSLTSIGIPVGVTYIGSGAFSNCSGLMDVYYGGTEEQWGAIEVETNNESYLSAVTVHFELDHPHCYEDVVTEPSCTEVGYTTHNCTVCGDSYCDSEVEATGHSYISTVTEPTCTEPGYTMHICSICGDSYTDSEVEAGGHSYESVMTEAGCMTDGYTTHTCTACGDSYRDSYVTATGHSWQEATCTAPMTCAVCGGTTGSALGHSYQSVVTAVGCLTDGYTTHTCTTCGNSYRGDYVTATGHSWVDATCTQPMTCTACGKTNGDALGHSFSGGSCTVCGEVDPDYSTVVQPTLALSYGTVSFESEILYNIYFKASDLDSVVEMGMITFDEELTDGTIDDAVAVYSNYSTDGTLYMVATEGIAAKNMADQMWFKIYAKLSDGSYVYTSVNYYSAVRYANSILGRTSSSAYSKALVVAMLNYGAEAQLYFGHNTDALANASLTDEQKALNLGYDETMVADVVTVDSAKAENFVYTASAFTKRYPSVSFDGAFSINFYFISSTAPDDGMTFYYWDAETYNSVDALTKDNATAAMDMTLAGTNSYYGVVDGIAAKEMDETVFVAGVYTVDGVEYTTGIIAYSLGKYCETVAAKDTSTQQAFAQATAVYGYYAKEYFANL